MAVLPPTPPPPPQAEPQAEPDQQSLLRTWWERYSPHGECFWSTTISFGAHVFLIVLILVFARPFASRSKLPPAIDSVALAEGEDLDSGESGNEQPWASGDPNVLPSPEEQPSVPPSSRVEVASVEKPNVNQPEVEPLRSEALEVGEEKVDDARARIAAARAALERRFAEPAKARRGAAGGGGSGGSGGGSGSGRGGRLACWLLKFDTRSAQDYLEQLEGLGASVIFPVPDRRGERWRYFDRPASEPGRWDERDLSNEGRLHWTDDNPQAIRSIMAILNIPSASFMVALLPDALEQRMLQLELSYQNRSEDEIRSTTFKVVQRGGKYDVIVIRQLLK